MVRSVLEPSGMIRFTVRRLNFFKGTAVEKQAEVLNGGTHVR